MMEWSAKSPLQWDWENLIMLNSKATECPKKSRPSEWAIDSEGFADFGSFYSPPGGRVGCASGSDLGHASSKSSKPASISSPSIGDIKTSSFFFEALSDMSEDFGNGKGFTDPHMTDNSRGYGESLLGLKLGRQTYPEDVSAGGDSKTPSLYAIPTPSETPTKKSKTVCLSTHAQRCQVEGCNLDLSSAKDYHRKHRVCENHSKCPKVIVGGQERRFCQQCSRFHGLSEFDEKKRSCRRRLSDHNARRRKPQPEAVQLNQGRLCSFNDMRQQMNLVLNRAPMVQARAATTLSWESTCLPAFTQTGGYPYKVTKPGVVDGQLISFGSNELPASVARVCHNPGRLLPSKAASTEALKGIEESGISSNMEETQDLHRALSLLSTDAWSSCEPKPASPPNTMHAKHSDSECWYAVQEPARSEVRRFQEFQLLKPPFEGGFYPH